MIADGDGVAGTERRAALAARVCAALAECCAGSAARLRGSLAAGTADWFSDIDLSWVVPDPAFPACLGSVRSVLDAADVRVDPDFAHSDRRRLLFVRFARVPLFWRLDLDVRAASVADEPQYDEDNPAARAADDEWSRPASALANAVSAVKAVARGQDATARGLLDRGFGRIDVPDRATGVWLDDVTRLARAAAALEPAQSTLAAQVVALAGWHLKRIDGTER